MGGQSATTYVAIHDDMGVVYMRRSYGNNTTEWCSFADSWAEPYASDNGFYPYLSDVWFIIPVSRAVFEARLKAARME